MRVHLVPVLCVGAVLVALEATLLGRIRVAGVIPDLTLLFALFLALHAPVDQSLAATWLLGLLHDVPSAGSFGASAFLFLVLCAVVSLLKEVLFRDHALVQVALVLAASFLYNGLYGGRLAQNSDVIGRADVLLLSAKVALYSAVVAPVCFGAFARFRHTFFDTRAH